MEKSEKVWLASKAAEKGWNYETLKYGDDLYDHEEDVEDVWGYVEEYKSIGSVAFREKYKEFKLYY